MPRDDSYHLKGIPRRSLKKEDITPSKKSFHMICSNVAFDDNMIADSTLALPRAIGVSSRVCKGKGAIAFWAGPNLVIWARYAFWARGHDSFIIDGSVNLKPSVTELNAVNDEAFIVDKKYVNFTDLNLVSDEKVSISDKDDLEKKDVYGSGAKTSDAVDVVIKEVESDNVDVNMNEVIADEDVDLDGNNVFVADKKSFLGDEDVDFCEKNYVVSEQKMFIGDEDVDFAQNNYVVLNCYDAKRDESGDADMNNCTDIPKFAADADTNGDDLERGKLDAFNVGSDNVDVNTNEVVADEDVDLAGNNVCVSDKKSFLGYEDVDYCDKNDVVSEQKMFIGHEDVELLK
ncbi:hypothetical protein Tco_0800956 [Tanacetum coccineum]|uniref:Uncharacterized protein n=1 Tax=Tanacetum coccineum TaxID=301880 RepID=A0ABQ4ZUQ1_9ASTR